jgi:hypothetical protein
MKLFREKRSDASAPAKKDDRWDSLMMDHQAEVDISTERDVDRAAEKIELSFANEFETEPKRDDFDYEDDEAMPKLVLSKDNQVPNETEAGARTEISAAPPVEQTQGRPRMRDVMASTPANTAPEDVSQALGDDASDQPEIKPIAEVMAQAEAEMPEVDAPKAAKAEQAPAAEPDAPASTAAPAPSAAALQAAAAAAVGKIPAAEKTAEDAASVPVTARRKSGRVKTRLLGFEYSDGTSKLFEEQEEAPTAAKRLTVKYPVGWIIVLDGPGRGHGFSLTSGMSNIGRGEDQEIQLDFGDNAISRNNHAAIAYDPDTHDFYLGHGGKANLVKLNGKPVVSTEQMASGDKILIGETTLQFIGLCSADFNWDESDQTDSTETSKDGEDTA